MYVILLDVPVTLVSLSVKEFFRRLYEMGEGNLRRTKEIGGQAVHMSAIFGRASDRPIVFPTSKAGGDRYRVSQAGAEQIQKQDQSRIDVKLAAMSTPEFLGLKESHFVYHSQNLHNL